MSMQACKELIVRVPVLTTEYTRLNVFIIFTYLINKSNDARNKTKYRVLP